MTALTLQFEDSLFKHLKKKADNIGYSVDNYVLYVLNKMAISEDQEDDIDKLLLSMQFQDSRVPATENGKGALAEVKYM